MDGPICSEFTVHKDVINKVRTNMPDKETVSRVSELFKVFGDSTRIRILSVLSVSDLCVCDITGLLGMTQSAVSHQLRVLKDAHLVTYKRSGKTVLYSLADNHVRSIFAQAAEHVNEKREDTVDAD